MAGGPSEPQCPHLRVGRGVSCSGRGRMGRQRPAAPGVRGALGAENTDAWPRFRTPGRKCVPGRLVSDSWWQNRPGTQELPRLGSDTPTRCGLHTDVGVQSLFCPRSTSLSRLSLPDGGPCPGARLPGGRALSRTLALGPPCTPACPAAAGEWRDSGFALFLHVKRIFRNCGKERFLPELGRAGAWSAH